MKQLQRTIGFRQWLPVLMVGAAPALLLCLPYLSVTAREEFCRLTGWQMLAVQGIQTSGLTATIPLLGRMGAVLTAIFPLLAATLYGKGRHGWAAVSFGLGVVSALLISLSGDRIARALQGAGLSSAAMNPSFCFYLTLAAGALGVVFSVRKARRRGEGTSSLSATALSDEDAIRRRRRMNRGKVIAAVGLGILPISLSFLPYLTLSFQGAAYSLSAWQLLTAAGIEVSGTLVSIPLAMRISVAVGALLSLLGIALLLSKKAAFAGGAFALSAATPLIVLLASSKIQTALAALNITRVVAEYQLPFTLTLVCGLLAGVLSVWTKGSEQLAQSIFLIFSCVSVGSVVILTGYMIISGAPAIAEIGLGNFLLGTEWKPSSNIYGILPLILSSVAGTLGAVVIGVPVGILTAVFLSETAPKRVASAVRPAVQLLAGIPSVIYGFFGMLVILPALRALFPGKTIGESLLAVILILAVMVLPTIVSVSENALRAVPVSYREAALALGTTPVKTIFKVTVPAAKSGILAGVILGVGRAIGETMAVIMVAGNAVNMPELLGTVRLLTTGIVMEMSYSSGLHRQALFAIGLVLFVFIMIVNIAFTVISRRGVQMDAK